MDGQVLFGPLSLEIGAGEWTCLLGASGIGKSTILRLVAGLEIGGRFSGTVTASDAGPVASRVTFMAQDDLLLPWLSVLQNVCLGARLRGNKSDLARAKDLISAVGNVSGSRCYARSWKIARLSCWTNHSLHLTLERARRCKNLRQNCFQTGRSCSSLTIRRRPRVWHTVSIFWKVTA